MKQESNVADAVCALVQRIEQDAYALVSLIRVMPGGTVVMRESGITRDLSHGTEEETIVAAAKTAAENAYATREAFFANDKGTVWEYTWLKPREDWPGYWIMFHVCSGVNRAGATFKVA